MIISICTSVCLQAQAETGKNAFHKKDIAPGGPKPKQHQKQSLSVPAPGVRSVPLPVTIAGDNVAARLGTKGAIPDTSQAPIPGMDLADSLSSRKKRGGKGRQSEAHLINSVSGGQAMSSSNAMAENKIGEATWISDPLRYEEMLRKMYGGEETERDRDSANQTAQIRSLANKVDSTAAAALTASQIEESYLQVSTLGQLHVII